MHSYQVLINESHLDTFGHVNNAKYLELYEQARWDLISGNNYGLKQIKKLKIGPVVLELDLKFKREIVNREVITIESRPQEITHPLIMEIHQSMVKADGSTASLIILKVGLMDLEKRKLITPTKEWLEAIKC
tara:strand:+ start:4355 stop:4750 length:396 start_codon:yes stop_codon:yes gene_type:complete